MRTIRYKIWRDLWGNKGRTLQVVLIIGMGAFALGMIITTRNLVVEGMEGIWRASSPAMIGLWTSPGVDDDALASLRRIDGLANIEGFAVGSVEWREAGSAEWNAGIVTARKDYEEQQYGRLDLISGRLPERDTAAFSQGTDTVYGTEIGDTVIFKSNGRERTYIISGGMYDPSAQPPSFGGSAQFFVSMDTFELLFGSRTYNRLLAGADTFDEVEVTALADALQDKLEKQEVFSGGFMPPQGDRVVNPNKHFFQETMDGIFLMLGVMAVLALFLGLFLVYNTINAILLQQVDQIGIMKAIGATSWQILRIYLLYVFSFGLLALVLAVPLGVLGGWGLNVFLLNSFNADPGEFAISGVAIGSQVVIALVTPLLVSLVPVISGARVSVNEAINTYGLDMHMGLLDRFLARFKHISRLLLLTITNTFRHKGRVILTQITLVLSGLIFMMVMSVSDSTDYTFNELLFSILNSNINLGMERRERISRVEELTRRHPDVKAVEMWGFGGASAHPAAALESEDDPGVTIFGVPPETTLYGYQMRDGRWLKADDTTAIVLNQEVAEDVGVGVGDWIALEMGSGSTTYWEVVGLYFDPLLNNSVHVSREVLLREQGSAGRADTIWVQIAQDDPASEMRVARELRQLYEDNGIDINPGGLLNGRATSSEIVDGINAQFRSIAVLLSVMALVIGIVGSISLSGVLSLNVIERQREIGVMRAVGASSWDITRMFVGEGLILGWLSWLIALPLSLPGGRLITEALSAALGSEIVYHYTPRGALIWLVVVSLLAVLASWMPARRASRLSVRNILAYS